MTSHAPIGVAVVGYGLAGQTFHAPLIEATPGLTLTAVVSSRPDAVHADLPEVAVLPDLDAALAHDDIGLIVVATPDALHAEQSIAALQAGKSVVVDKPFAATLADAQAVAAVAAASPGVFSVFQNRRWDADFLTLRRLIADGELGDIAVFESHYDRFRPTVTDRWKDQRYGGVWADLGPHLIDQAVQLFGPPLAVYADLQAQRQGATAIDYAHVLLRYDRLRVILNMSHLAAEASLRYVVHGTGGSFIKHGLDAQESQSKAGLRPGHPDWGLDPTPGVLTQQIDGQTLRTTPTPERGDYPAFYAAVRDAIQGKGPPPVPADQALTVMRILDAGLRSAAEAREVSL
ncbi:MAG: oxidoreductase [Alphaproteobacteria bacterium]|uniref:Scyllo-inositol 2-dehydrogenase (NADP(+)) n=1 Tax=Brevundimonas mediterranea TaxID=74329 RepID=A0A7Z8Y5Y9_9CAUL|nr:MULTISPECIES: oxidoreductase [Brevundimonas]MBU4196584.1 oxidoreductase [Alphaproteobacteria bacterium]MBU4239198.1 oxidoreductase [Alphaproteobacteria bacterium]MCG2664383.1 oxidoreductase [Brevundimonas sp.]VDC51489.1 scyllo-inositol 2-dehydrogenase (NADP(+)) [Brevundimonas mediterranea]